MLGFLSKDPSKMLFFDGDSSKLSLCFDSSEGIEFADQPFFDTREEVDFSFYGKSSKVKIPIVKRSELDIFLDVSKGMKAYIGDKAAKDLISDDNFGKRTEVFALYDIYEIDGKYYFCEKTQRNYLDFDKDSEDELVIMTMLEFMQGYVRMTAIEFSLGGEKQPMQLGRLVSFLEGQIKVGHNYTISLRKIMFGDIFKEFHNSGLLQSWQYKVIKYMCMKTYIVAPRRSGKSYVLAYIALRELFMESFKPEVRERPLTVLYLSLNKGLNLQVKAYMDKMISRMGKDENQKKVIKSMLVWDAQNSIYKLVSGGTVIGQIVFLTAKGDDPGIGYPGDLVIIDEMFRIPGKIKEGLDSICSGEDAKFFGASTMYKDSPRDWARKEIVQIEKKPNALRNKNEEVKAMWKDYKTLSEKAKWDVSDMVEYQDKVMGFREKYPEISLRFTIDDIDRHNISGRAERWKKEYLDKGDYERYITELYSRFREEGAAITYKSALIDPSFIPKTGNKLVLGSNDPALSPKSTDVNSLVLVTYDEYSNKIYIAEEKPIIKTGKVVDAAKDIKPQLKKRDSYGKSQITSADQNLEGKYKNIQFVGDASVTQKSIWELYEQYGLYYVGTISSRNVQVAKQSSYNSRNRDVSKEEMVKTFQECIDNGWLGINADLLDFKAELDEFMEISPGKYECVRKTGTDDRVNAAIVGVYWMYKVMNVRAFLAKETIPQFSENMTKMERIALGRVLAKQDAAKKARADYQKELNNYYLNNVS